MKTKLVKLINTIVLCFIAFTSAYSAEIGFFVGDVKGERKGKPFKMSLGLALEAGDIIQTGSKSTLELRYKNRTSITLSENTLVKIGNANVPSSDEVTVVSGKALAVFGKISKGENKVYTPTTICAVRGTEFVINVNKGNSMVILNKGKLDVNNSYSEISMNAGDNIQADVGEKIEKSSQNRKQWNEDMLNSFDSDLDKAIKAYSKYVNDLDSSAKVQSADMKKYPDRINSAVSVEDMKSTGKGIEKVEELIRDELYLTEGTNYSLQLILDGLPNKSKEFSEFSKIKEKCNNVAALKAKNYAEIQAIKQQHKEAVDKIRDKFDSDKSKILEGVKKQKDQN